MGEKGEKDRQIKREREREEEKIEFQLTRY